MELEQDLELSSISQVVTFALRELFLKPDRIPHDPFKQIVQSIQSQEYAGDQSYEMNIKLKKVRFPHLSTSFLKMIRLGSSNGYSLAHLAGMVSISSINRTRSYVEALSLALGSLEKEVKSRGVEASFISVPSIHSCMKESLAQPSSHRLEICVEAIIKNTSEAPFDDCMSIYIRRILEEAIAAEQSRDILIKQIRVKLNSSKDSSVQIIDTKSLRTHRQQVISILKAATVGEGEVTMELLLKVSQRLTNFTTDIDPSTLQNTESTTGYIRIIRRYNFNYVDDKGFNRCFARHPFQSLAAGIFLDAEEIKTYAKVYDSYIKKMIETERKDYDVEEVHKTEPDAPDTPDDPRLMTYLHSLTEQIRRYLHEGEYVKMAERLCLMIYLMLEGDITKGSHNMQRIGLLMYGDIGRIHATRCALRSIRALNSVLYQKALDVLEDYQSVAGGGDFDDLMKGAGSDLKPLTEHFRALGSTLYEIKVMVLSLVRNVRYSEFHYVMSGLQDTLWKFMELDDRVKDLADSIRNIHTRRSFVLMLSLLRELEEQSHVLSCYLHSLEASMGNNIFAHLVLYDQNVSDTSNAELRKFHAWNESPKSMKELVGYLHAFSEKKINKNTLDGGSFVWFMNFAGESDVMYKWGLSQVITWDSIIKYWKSIVREGKLSFDPRQSPKLHFAEIDPLAAQNDEEARNDLPTFLIAEAWKMRYLSETHCLRAIHEAVFKVMTDGKESMDGDRLRSPISIIAASLSRMSAFLTLGEKVDKDQIASQLFATARTEGGIQKAPGCFGACKITISHRLLDTKLAVNDATMGGSSTKETGEVVATQSTGGIYGPNRVLSAVGYEVNNLYFMSWLIPPLMPYIDKPQPGLKMTISCGMHMNSAMFWSMPLESFHGEDEAEEENDDELVEVRGALSKYSLLNFPPVLELEVVVRVVYDFPGAEARLRRVFGYELSKCCRQLITADEWKLNQVFINYKESEGRGLGMEKNTNVSFDGTELQDDSKVDAAMAAAAGRSGFAVIHCAVLFPEKHTVEKNGLVDVVAAMIAKRIEQNKGDSDSDPTAEEKERIAATYDGVPTIASSVQKYMLKNNIKRPYTPCRIKFSLLGIEPEMTMRSGRMPNNASKDDLFTNTKEREGALVMNKVKLGQKSVFRLLTSTLYFSPQACVSVYAAARAEGVLGYCIECQRNRLLTLFRDEFHSGKYLNALKRMRDFALLSCQYQKFMEVTRAHTYIAFTLDRITSYTKLCRNMLEHVKLSTIDLGAFSNTLTHKIGLGLRLVLIAPETLHLRGGCRLILKSLLEMEQLLGLEDVLSKTLSDEQQEAMIRNALGITDTRTRIVDCLNLLEGVCQVLLEAMGKDIAANIHGFSMVGIANSVRSEKEVVEYMRTDLPNSLETLFGQSEIDVDNQLINGWLDRQALSMNVALTFRGEEGSFKVTDKDPNNKLLANKSMKKYV